MFSQHNFLPISYFLFISYDLIFFSFLTSHDTSFSAPFLLEFLSVDSNDRDKSKPGEGTPVMLTRDPNELTLALGMCWQESPQLQTWSSVQLSLCRCFRLLSLMYFFWFSSFCSYFVDVLCWENLLKLVRLSFEVLSFSDCNLDCEMLRLLAAGLQWSAQSDLHSFLHLKNSLAFLYVDNPRHSSVVTERLISPSMSPWQLSPYSS